MRFTRGQRRGSKPGERIEGIRDARPEIRSALERAEKFLSLAALVSVVLAAVAIGLAARRFLQRHLDALRDDALPGCEPKARSCGCICVHFIALGIVASAIGCAIGVAAQALLAHWLGSLVAVELPPPGFTPGIAWRRDGARAAARIRAAAARLSGPRADAAGAAPGTRRAAAASGFATYGAGLCRDLGARAVESRGAAPRRHGAGRLRRRDVRGGALTWLLCERRGGLRGQGFSWRHGVANLQRRALGSTVQVVALGIGMMALLVLTMIRHDLLAGVADESPARGAEPVHREHPARPGRGARGVFRSRTACANPTLSPMVRGRLTRINERRRLVRRLRRRARAPADRSRVQSLLGRAHAGRQQHHRRAMVGRQRRAAAILDGGRHRRRRWA